MYPGLFLPPPIQAVSVSQSLKEQTLVGNSISELEATLEENMTTERDSNTDEGELTSHGMTNNLQQENPEFKDLTEDPSIQDSLTTQGIPLEDSFKDSGSTSRIRSDFFPSMRLPTEKSSKQSQNRAEIEVFTPDSESQEGEYLSQDQAKKSRSVDNFGNYRNRCCSWLSSW